MVHFAADTHCNASKYPEWYAQFELAMAAQDRDGTTGFMSYMLPGNHDDAYKFWESWDFADHVDWFEAMWLQLDRNRSP